MICRYLDDRHDFFSILGQKLGPPFRFIAAPNDTTTEDDASLIILGMPPHEDPTFEGQVKILREHAARAGAPPMVTFLRSAAPEMIRTALEAGAHDYFVEMGSMDELRHVLQRTAHFHHLASEVHRLGFGLEQGFEQLAGKSVRMREVCGVAKRAAVTDANILITGETGTGKELLAHAIHQSSQRAAEPFMAVSCASLPESLIESELFGHERGAFTGAVTPRIGRLEAVRGGTLFLDEIGEISPTLQVKLLRMLQERRFERLGSNHTRELQARIICATNRDLKQRVRENQFRADLYYRVNTIELHLAPLQERREDIPALSFYFIQKYARKHRRAVHRISPAALRALEEHSWPGNIRELEHVIERAIVLADEPQIRIEHLPVEFCSGSEAVARMSLEDEVRHFKKRVIARALAENENNKLHAAKSLGIARSSLHRLIEELQIEVEAIRALDPDDHEPGLTLVRKNAA